ncbi:unnamed protein product, partial [Mesorhabditis belari]|uniref:M23ase beta-sheet core domain-containing protein n=1 Tax=Mesorhabditis belari TaxID=2138241 RepID=A0AAF3ELN8_9BILA
MILCYLFLSFLLSEVSSLGCIPQICADNRENRLRGCPDSDGGCGHYQGERSDGEIVDAVDIVCSRGQVIYAPFDGEMYYFKPFGGAEDKECADEGARIEGSGQWQGYVAHIASVKLDFYGGKVKKGDPIGKAIDQGCTLPSDQRSATPSIEMKLFREGKPVDPTFHLRECMCTGQICESNSKNTFLGNPFKSDKRFNGVRGWDLECRMVEEDGESPKAPLIYSPIEGELIGRTRLAFDANGAYSGCENDGIFIVGTRDWAGFEVRIYNVRVRAELEFGRQNIIQGQPIARRLSCESAPDSVFLEIRYEGKVVDVSDMISANKCQLPEDLKLA